jgi:hydrogenase-1 operon protein HyaF
MHPSPRPFPIPVVAALGPGSQAEDEALDYLRLPSGMHTYQSPRLPEPEQLAGHCHAGRVLRAVLAALQAVQRGQAAAPVPLHGLAAPELALVNQVLGEGEVSAQVLAQPETRHFAADADTGAGAVPVRVQESVFTGVWRVQSIDGAGRLHDHVEVGAVPSVLRTAAADDARAPRDLPPPLPAGLVNVPTLLVELQDRRERWQPGQAPHVVNLSLLPLAPGDIAHIDHQLGTGRVVILSRGYGNCRITNTRVAHTWRVVYYNSQDAVILNTIEVCGLPEVACAAAEDLADSAERLAEVLEWLAPA